MHLKREKMNKKHLKIAQNLQKLAIKKFKTINPEELTTNEMLKILSAGINLERSLEEPDIEDNSAILKEFIKKNLEEE